MMDGVFLEIGFHVTLQLRVFWSVQLRLLAWICITIYKNLSLYAGRVPIAIGIFWMLVWQSRPMSSWIFNPASKNNQSKLT